MIMRLFTVLLLVMVGAATAEAGAGRRALLAAEGMDTACLGSKCLLQLLRCTFRNPDCARALAGTAACLTDPLLTSMISGCNPLPSDRSRAKLMEDQCTNLAVYLFKDNSAFYDLTRCAQENSCLTGVTAADQNCPPAVPVSNFTSRTAFETAFESMAVTPSKTYKVVRGLNYAWDCYSGQTFVFSKSTVNGALRARYSVNIGQNTALLRYPYLKTLGGRSPAIWPAMNFVFDSTLGLYRESLNTAGVFEADPWLVLSPYLGSNPPQYVLAIMAVNVGPDLTNVQYGMPGGYILALSTASSTVPTAALNYWQALYPSLIFADWCSGL